MADRPRRPRRVALPQALARLAGHIARLPLAFAPRSLADAHLTILPFQLEPALALLAGRRRLLVADDVGLGKTVQAALLLRALIDARADARALVIAPVTLLRQWSEELASRVALSTHLADAMTLARHRAGSTYLANPWLSPGIWLTSPDFLKQPHVIDGLPPTPWDLLIIDEAHLLSGDSQRHQAIDALAHDAHRVILLTATPHDGDDARFRRLLSIGTRGDAITLFRRTRAADTHQRRTRWLPVRLSPWDHRALRLIDAFERTARPLRRSDARDGLPLICAVFRRRTLSSPHALAFSVQRREAILDRTGLPPDPWRQPGLFDEDLLGADEDDALSADSGLPTAYERDWLQRLRRLCAGAPAGGRARALAALLRRTREPAIVFTQYRDSLAAVVRALPDWRRPAILHGGLPAAAQRQALDTFLTGRADTLVTTDVASQGLNLQTASRWTLSFDVPSTPLRLEQRAGRVDRLGQRRRVHATILTSRHPHDRVLRDRIDARERRSHDAPWMTCRRWMRAAEGLAAWYGHQRRLAQHWRAAVEPAACEALVPPAFVRRWLGRAASGLVCMEVPLLASTGEVLERRIVAAGLDEPAATIRAHAARRAGVLTRRLRLRAARAGRAQPPPHTPAQPGLFERTLDTAPRDTPRDDLPITVTAGEPRVLVRFLARGGAHT